MRKSYYTFSIIPHTSNEVKSLCLPNWVLVIAGVGFFSILTIMFILSWYVINMYSDFKNLTLIKETNQLQASEIKDLKKEISDLKLEFTKLGEREEELKHLMGFDLEDSVKEASNSKGNSDIEKLNEIKMDASLPPFLGRGGSSLADEEITISVWRGKKSNELLSTAGMKEELAEMSLELNTYQKIIDNLIKKIKADPKYYRSLPNLLPVEGRLTSSFGLRASPFNQRIKEMHYGIDLAAPYGTPVKAAGEGVISFSGYKAGLGYTVIIDHGNNLMSYYGHNCRLLVDKGEQVKKGQVISLLGNSGRSTGPHLHFAIELDGQFIDPFILLNFQQIKKDE